MKTRRQPSIPRPESWITTAELAQRTAGGDDYIRTKGNQVKGLALNPDLNRGAPNIVVVGKGPKIETRASRFLADCTQEPDLNVPNYLKHDTNAWELVGNYRAIEYRTDGATIRKHRGDRPLDEVAGILFLERTDEATVDVRGGGFGDPATRRVVELAAIAFVWTHFESQGYTIYDYQRDNLGYDLLAVKSDSTLKLEVKGTDGVAPRFFLTRNERKCAALNADWRLVLVTSARTAPQLQTLTIQDVERIFNLDPLAWECTPRE